MEKTYSKKPEVKKQSHPFLTGFMAGLVVGVGLCAAVAIYIARSPSPFQNKALESIGANKDLTPLKPAPPKAPVEVPVTADVTPAPPPPAEDTKPMKENSPAPQSTGSGNLYLQVGAFGSTDDAEKQVETVAQITGVHAKVVMSTIEGNKTLYKVRIGPFNQLSDSTELVQILKSNKLPYVIVRPAIGETPR
jgi:cell division protein FtsN